MNSRYEFFIKSNICLLYGMENIISYRCFLEIPVENEQIW